MPQVWVSALVRLAVFLLAGVAIGWLYDEPLIGLLVVALIALGWNLVWSYRLDRWLHGRKMQHLPDGAGVWSQMFARVDFIKSRSKLRNKRFKALMKQMRQATRAFPDGGIILSDGNEIVTMNRVAEELLGLKRKPDRGLRIENLIRDPDFVDYLRAESYTTAIEFVSPLGHEQWLSCHQVPYGLDQKLLLIRDITQQRGADEMRRDFVANASHELRTPLTVITGYLDALADDESVSGDLQRPLDEMQCQADRMRTLVEELLKLSEIESKGPAPEGNAVNIAALIAAARQEAQSMINSPKNIDLELESDADLSGDEADIQSVLTNLVSNAVRYTPEDGRIVIRWSVDEQGGHLAVIDTGGGIAREHLPRLTERFYRVEDGRERIGGDGGTGLGLAIVKHALQRHLATLAIESEPGSGSSFICNFPRERIVTVA